MPATAQPGKGRTPARVLWVSGLLLTSACWWTGQPLAAGSATTARSSPQPLVQTGSGTVAAQTVTPAPTSAQAMQAGGVRPPTRLGNIPLPEGVRAETAVGSEQEFSLITQLPYERVTDFYRTAMPESGWQAVEDNPRQTAQTSQLHYTRGAQQCALVITRAPFVGTVIYVHITP